MLQKNVYILYPPGYCGSYINWAIHASDKELQKITVKDPLNNKNSAKYGGYLLFFELLNFGRCKSKYIETNLVSITMQAPMSAEID